VIDLLDLDPTDPVVVSMSEALSGERPAWRWPRTADECAGAFGYGTWASAWLCDEASGNLSDAFGGVTLTAGSTPTYRNAGVVRSAATDFAVGFNSANDRFEAASSATFDLGASDSLALFLSFSAEVGGGFTPMAGKVVGASPYWGFLMNASGHLVIDLFDGVDNVTNTYATNHGDSLPHDVLFIIDRDGPRSQIFTEQGSSTATNIAAIGSMANAKTFHLGGTSAFSTPTYRLAYAAVATGGIAALRAAGATAITNIRRWTGRV
jgi:hypothetical protein